MEELDLNLQAAKPVVYPRKYHHCLAFFMFAGIVTKHQTRVFPSISCPDQSLLRQCVNQCLPWESDRTILDDLKWNLEAKPLV